ncbi:EscU/YscU/HrcU family type III secretion system export apparatus switch protein [Marinobacterium sediminicola]|uniref:Flagellar biosynthetic protein FlhB n=1 Tax=Marinobacterium sediminicola TaxID=518898 RepID=A0ABY1RYH3_9GAMM|nr:EscU/YscU/HrcU family type III secretion system export apparatus switch protein [Marinobacterium sediminicola]ULG68747.1 EscU/YscU/HrcU family type III secretion system export apparatus switch protein [Marinobacterium sediminicola]SMR73275.1 flagellar biosynthesis protein [Marinobacterium sediminicola]
MNKPVDKERSAVALKYDPDNPGAPRVVAKGRGLIAEQILALAEEHDIHIHQSPELIEVLIRLELGEEIPEALYRAIAEVIAFAYGLRDSGDTAGNQ